MINKNRPLIQVSNLTKRYKVGKVLVDAVRDVSFSIYPGEILGLVGESGCGKSTIAKTILRLQEPTSGEILFDGKDLCKLSDEEMKHLRRQMQMIFQDPYASLNPRMTVEDIIGEGLDIHCLAKGNERKVRILQLLDLVHMPKDCITRYPHQFSGGQRQRIGIARALAVEPKFLVCDEPVSALDVTTQIQIVNLLKELRRELQLTCLFISHDLNVVRDLADRVAVMYFGGLVEMGSSEKLYGEPLHPYTQALISSIPIPDPIKERSRLKIVLKGEIPSPMNPPKGCPFQTRCPKAISICKKKASQWQAVQSEHFVSCHLFN